MISVGYISNGDEKTHFSNSLYMMGMQDKRITKVHVIISGPRIATARNDVIKEFLKTDNQWILLLDSDMVFAPDLLEKLLATANERIRPVVGGLCFGGGRVGIPFPTLYALTSPKENNGRVTKVISNYPKDALCKVDATGAACLLIHRDVLLNMEKEFGNMPDGYSNPHPWFAETVHMGHEYGEDWTFCMRLRQLKVPIYVNTAAKLGHVKTQIYDEEFYEQWRKFNA